ncbi:Ras1 guanine nucleotide exchange factor [Ceraceosorus bombacis]|uniref:Ras1 guanine nucleotide exchange factor n=1 Tax=Ceraceosorus bombacis TaxID=401625 RepID=A0A0P1BKA7_9BASI|nr:Ras1 guanine nucleotide exchange factor [Ceraceosorus bombacis]
MNQLPTAARRRSNLGNAPSAAAAVSTQAAPSSSDTSKSDHIQLPTSSSRTAMTASIPAAGSGASAATLSSFPDASSAPDVETTNWNAVKLLATKYGIYLRPYEEEEAAAAAAVASAQASSSTSSSVHPSSFVSSDATATDELDYGRGTPFRITAKRIEGGRTVYRFKYRNDPASQADAMGPNSSSPTIPRSSSESVALAASHDIDTMARLSVEDLSAGTAGDSAFKARRGRAGSKGNASAAGSTGRSSKGKSKALKTSKSIPTLRSMGLMGASSGQAKNAGGSSSAASGWVVVPPLPGQAKSGNTTPMPQISSTLLSPPHEGGHATNQSSRSFSGPLNARDRLTAAEADRLQGGDVLGAILGLRQEQQQEVQHAQEQQQQHILSRYEAKGEDVSLRTGLEAHAAANLSRRAAPPSSWRGASPFGHPVVPMTRGSSATSSSSGKAAVTRGTSWDTSPIPQMTSFGEPLFKDVHKFAAAQGRSPYSSDQDQGPDASGNHASARHARSLSDSRSPASPRQRLLREAQSFESADSAATARAGEEKISLSTLPPAILPHLDISECEEILCDEGYRDEDDEAERMVPLSAIRAKDEETLIFDVLQHYALTDAASITSPATSTSGGDSKRSSLATTLSSSGEDQSPVHTRSPSSTEDPALGTSGANAKESARVTIASATCGDDPRFAIWAMRSSDMDGQLQLCGRDGKVLPDSPQLGDTPFGRQAKASAGDDGSASSSQLGNTAAAKRYSTARAVTGEGASAVAATSSPTSAGQGTQQANGRARSGSRSKRTGSASGAGSFMSSTSTQPKPFLIAGTSTRIVSELTSEIDGRLLTDFFLTFRSFMTASELLSLLIMRFKWAMAQVVGPSDEAQRRIVRVRTYVVLKHWLSNFFEADFLPDRALRRQLTEWLNRIGSEQELRSRPADAGIIRSLKKLVRSLKEQYQSAGMSGLLLHESGRSDSNQSEPSPEAGHSSAAFAASFHGTQSVEATSTEEVDLNFSEDSGEDAPKKAPFTIQQSLMPSRDAAPELSSADIANVEDADGVRALYGRGGAARLVRHRHTLAPATRQQAAPPSPLQPYSSTASGTSQSGMLPPVLPSSQNPISRVFVNTVGRISRFRRVIGQRGAPNNASEANGIDGLEFEANESGDLLFIRGGLENFISFFGLRDEDQKGDIRHALASHLHTAEERALAPSELTEDEALGNISSDSAGESAGMEGTPSLSGASAQTRSTPASSLDLSASERELPVLDASARAGLGIEGAGIASDPGSNNALTGPDAKAVLTSTDHDPLLAEQGELSATTGSSLGEAAINEVSDGGQHPVHHAPSASTLRSDSTVIRTPSLRKSTAPQEPRSSMLSSRYRGLGSRQSIRSIASMQRTSSDRPNIVQIDDIDLSSDEDDGVVRRALRRLPGARDLRMAQHVQDLEPTKAVRMSMESLASFNPGQVYSPIGARASVGNASLTRAPGFGGPGSNYAPSILSTRMSFMERQRAEAELLHPDPVIGMLQTDLFDPDEALAGYELVRGFRLDLADSDDEEPGDVEAALRRLEGVIDEDKQRSKAKRVEKLFLESLARNAQTSTGAQLTGPAADDSQIAGSEAVAQTDGSKANESHASIAEAQAEPRASSVSDLPDLVAALNADRQGRFEAQRSELPAPRLGENPKQRRKSHGGALSNTLYPGSAQQTPQLSNAQWNPPPVHRSFLLQYSSESMAQQLCLIEAELLKAVTWEELVSDRWKQTVGVVNDWETFYQGRVRAKAEAISYRKAHTDSAVSAIVARFNLTCNWVASEIVLTQNVDERAAVVAKFIRVAFKCWQHSNFASLAQIIFGLQSPWVERLRRTWSRVGMWEMRVLRDLKSFVSPVRNFRLMRNAMRDMVSDAYVDDMASVGTARPPSVRLNGATAGGATAKGTVSEGCIPFFGLFISDLAINDALPSLLDPSSPSTQPVDLSKSAHAGLKPELIPAEPRAFDHLPPLPPSIRLEPLINVYKARNTAAIVKTVMAFQQRARLYPYEASAAVYVKALKIRSLDSNQMTQVSYIAES